MPLTGSGQLVVSTRHAPASTADVGAAAGSPLVPVDALGDAAAGGIVIVVRGALGGGSGVEAGGPGDGAVGARQPDERQPDQQQVALPHRSGLPGAEASGGSHESTVGRCRTGARSGKTVRELMFHRAHEWIGHVRHRRRPGARPHGSGGAAHRGPARRPGRRPGRRPAARRHRPVRLHGPVAGDGPPGDARRVRAPPRRRRGQPVDLAGAARRGDGEAAEPDRAGAHARHHPADHGALHRPDGGGGSRRARTRARRSAHLPHPGHACRAHAPAPPHRRRRSFGAGARRAAAGGRARGDAPRLRTIADHFGAADAHVAAAH